MHKLFIIPAVRLCPVLALLCSACGGSGGAPQSSPPPPGPPPPPMIVEPAGPVISYSGSRQAIVVSQTNAAELAYRSVSMRRMAQVLESFWVDPPPGPFENELTSFGQLAGEVDLRTEIDAAGRGYVEAVFRNFSDTPDESINGRFLLRYRPEVGGVAGMDYSFAGPGNLEFDDLTFTQSGFSSKFHGVVRISGANSSSFDINLTVTDDPGGDALFFENCRIEFSAVSVGGNDRPGLEISGTVYDSIKGGITFSPLGPIPDLGFSELAGYIVGGAGGGIELISSGPITHFRPISFAFASIVMDLNGDGAPDSARRYSWPELAGESTVESSVLTGPIANAGNRRTPKPGLPVKLHSLFSHDDDRDWLTFDWRIIAKPGQSTLSIDNVSTNPYFEFTPDVAGDYVFGVRASDGITASESSTTIRHAPSEIPDANDEPSGGLEVGQPIAKSIPITIDGRSSINWPYSLNAPSWLRLGFGQYSFGDTGSLNSTYLTVENDGLNQIQFSHNSQFAGASSSSAKLNLAVGPTIFETRIDLVGSANAHDVHKLDLDNDGDDDIVLRVGTNGDERIQILVSTPQGLIPGPDVSAGSGELAPGDLDGDGLFDFLNSTDDGLWVFSQNPDHSLAAPVSIPYPPSGCATIGGTTDIGLADVDGDGMIDILAVHPCDDAVVTWLQNIDGSFGAPISTAFPNHQIKNAAFGDIDGDGRADVITSLSAISTAFPHGVAISIAQSDGTIVQRDFIENTGLTRPGVTIGDINDDQRNDLIIVGRSDVDIMLQAADGTLNSTTIDLDMARPALQPAVSLVDLDGDNTKDLFACDSGPSMRLLRQEQNGTFTDVVGPRCSYFGRENPEIAVSLDVNGDGHIDLLTVSEDARGAIDDRVLLNVYLQDVHEYPIAVIE